MEHYEQQTETRTYRVLTKTTCDICKNEIPKYKKQGEKESKGKITYDSRNDWHRDVEYHFNMDICGSCFREKIIPLLKWNLANVEFNDDVDDYSDDGEESWSDCTLNDWYKEIGICPLCEGEVHSHKIDDGVETYFQFHCHGCRANFNYDIWKILHFK